MFRELTCRDVAALISADLDGLLSRAEQLVLYTHLQRCTACSALRAQFLFIQRCSLHGRTPRRVGLLQ